MRQRIAILLGGECRHQRTIVVDSVGVRRVVCEVCGHISFEMADLSAPRSLLKSKPRALRRVAGL